MTDHFDSSQSATIDRDNRLMAAAGFALSQILNDLYDLIAAGSIGITADAQDVDSVALGGGEFTRDKDTADGSTLLFAWHAGRFLLEGRTLVAAAAGSLTLSASATNYVECDSAGTVTSNTSGFTAGRLPLWTVVTGSSSYSDGNVTSKKPHLCLFPDGGITGTQLSTAGKTKELPLQLGTIATSAGSTVFTVRLPTTVGTGTITKISFVAKDALAASDTNYIKFGVVNKGAAGGGSTAVVDITSAANSTKVTGGTALAAYTPRDLVIASAPVTGGDVLEITLTVTGTLANTLTESSLLIELTHTN